MEAEINTIDVLEAGTGFMQSLSSVIHQLDIIGYSENLSAKIDHFECRSGQFKLYPKDVVIDNVFRFENTSDPDDQSILYAISAPSMGLRGIYVESYGIHQDELCNDMIERLKNHPH
jgi:hypothetical protein